MTIQEIKSIKAKADIIKVIGSLIPLKKDGVHYFGQCPFHNEKSNSLSVSSIKGIFKCFGCGKSGDVIDFVMHNKSMTYTAAIQWISDHENIHADIEHVVEQFVEPEPSFIPPDLMHKSMSHGNNFMYWLNNIFPHSSPDKYAIGSSKHWPGAVVFWYLDISDRIRSGKIMQYDPTTGKRIKSPKPLVTWVHRVLRIKDFNFSVCLFGEHLLSQRPNDPICVVESEKSAIVASIEYPDKIWLASGGLTYMTYARMKVLEGRDITLYPDVGAEERWFEKMQQLRDLIMADWKMMKIENKPRGYDICDLIVDKI